VAENTVENELIECEGHGPQPTTLVCTHLIEAAHGDTSMGFNWSEDEGDFVANCDACELECDDEGFFPDDLVEEIFVITCKGCFDEIALAHGVTIPLPAPTSAAKT
jgi:hypothetical protein